MSSGLKCNKCGSTDIEEDNARGDAVCTNCGSVLEDSLIVSEVQFDEGVHGSGTLGQFVSADSTGGATAFSYGKFNVGSGAESREVTMKKAKREISHICHQLQLSQHYIDTSVNFFKLSLMRNLTRGRKNTHVYAACVYITCRTEGTSHLLIDISDIQQICSYELGRTYLKLTQALCINIPSVDPCLYIMRFCNRLQFGSKMHEVSMTALRIMQRMKKDSLHSGRRPTGLCGAALLIAARMHDFNRTINDIVRVVKIHESTIRKRLNEFADTPSSALTLDEFMAVDLEAEQDPPAYKAARKRDRDRIKDVGVRELTQLQKEIEMELERDYKKSNKHRCSHLMRMAGVDGEDSFLENIDTVNFIEESNMDVIKQCLLDTDELMHIADTERNIIMEGLKPDIESMCHLTASEMLSMEEEKAKAVDSATAAEFDLNLEDLDDEEINNYILTHDEALYKNKMWKALNAEYLKEQELKEERLAKDREEGKPERKKRKMRKKGIGPSTSAGEAIEKMLQEKRISSKINYDILKSLNVATPAGGESRPVPDQTPDDKSASISEMPADRVDRTREEEMAEEEEEEVVVKEVILSEPPPVNARNRAPLRTAPMASARGTRNKVPRLEASVVGRGGAQSPHKGVQLQRTPPENNDDIHDDVAATPKPLSRPDAEPKTHSKLQREPELKPNNAIDDDPEDEQDDDLEDELEDEVEEEADPVNKEYSLKSMLLQEDDDDFGDYGYDEY